MNINIELDYILQNNTSANYTEIRDKFLSVKDKLVKKKFIIIPEKELQRKKVEKSSSIISINETYVPRKKLEKS